MSEVFASSSCGGILMSKREREKNKKKIYAVFSCWQALLKDHKFAYVLDMACVQFEPDNPEYIRVSVCVCMSMCVCVWGRGRGG